MVRAIGTFVLSSLLLMSAAVGQTSAATAELLLHKSGTWEQLGSVEAQTRASLEQALSAATPRPSAAEIERIGKVVASAYAAPKLRAAAARAVAANLDEKHLRDIQAWFDSSTGQAITRLEEQFSAATENADPRWIAAQGAALLEQGSDRRRTLIGDLVREMKAADGLVEVTFNVTLAIQRGVMVANPSAPRVPDAELRAQLEQQRPTLVQAYEVFSRASSALIYKALADGDLEQYLAYLKSPAGAHFNAVSLLALDRALSAAGEELGTGLSGTRDQANT